MLVTEHAYIEITVQFWGWGEGGSSLKKKKKKNKPKQLATMVLVNIALLSHLYVAFLSYQILDSSVCHS